nr:hypothetical protein [Clostridia bacterium]
CFYVGRQTKEQVVLLSRRLSGRAVFAAGAQNLYRYAVPPATRPDKACVEFLDAYQAAAQELFGNN